MGEPASNSFASAFWLRFDASTGVDIGGEPQLGGALRFSGRLWSRNRVARLLDQLAKSRQPFSAKFRIHPVEGYRPFERRALTPSSPAVSACVIRQNAPGCGKLQGYVVHREGVVCQSCPSPRCRSNFLVLPSIAYSRKAPRSWLKPIQPMKRPIVRSVRLRRCASTAPIPVNPAICR